MKMNIESARPRSKFRVYLLAALALACVLLPSCLILDGSYDDRELVSFAFKKESNPLLRKARIGTIGEGVVNIEIPDYMDASSLVADFGFEGLEVRVDGRIQESGVSPNDFTRQVVYEVLGKDDGTTRYIIEAERVAPDSSTEFMSMDVGNPIGPYDGEWYCEDFSTSPELTLDSLSDSDAVVDIDDYYSSADPSRLYLHFLTEAAEVTANGIVLAPNDPQSYDYNSSQLVPYSENNFLDFTSPVAFRVVAEDGTTRNHTIRITKKPKLQHFQFLSGINPGLTESYSAAIDSGAGTVEIDLPFGVDPSSLVATFYAQADAVEVDGDTQTSGVSANDFSSPVDYTLRGSYGSDATFRVVATILPPVAGNVVGSIRIHDGGPSKDLKAAKAKVLF